MHLQLEDLYRLLLEGEDIISGLEAQADNAGLDLVEAREWWIRARKLLDSISGEKEANSE